MRFEWPKGKNFIIAPEGFTGAENMSLLRNRHTKVMTMRFLADGPAFYFNPLPPEKRKN